MSVLPDTKIGRVQFCEEHVPTWTTNAVAIGTTAAAVTDLSTKTVAARAAFLAQQTAQSAAKDATNTFDLAVDAMNTAAASIIKQVRVKAATAGDSVYSLASIPVPATPSPMGPLGTPSDFKVALTATGTLELSWKCTNPRGATGTIYQLSRRIGATGDFVYLGSVGEKKFLDSTVPAGSSQVAYQIQAVRSTSSGAVALFNVIFGVSGAGAIVASVASAPPGAPVRIAA